MGDNLMPGEEGAIPTGMLDKFKNQGNANPVTVDDINKFNFGLSPEENAAYEKSQEQFAPVKEPLSVHDYYPNLNDPTAQGNFSGSWNGGSINATTYAPAGAIVPIGMWDARDAAIQKAAVAKARDVEDWKKRTMVAPTSRLSTINDENRKQYFQFENNWWDRGMKMFKGDGNKTKYWLENNTDYQAEKKGHFDRAKMGDEFVNKVEKIRASQDKGYIVTPELQKEMDAGYGIADPNSDYFKNTMSNVMKMNTVADLNDTFNTAIKDIHMEQLAHSGIDQSDPDMIKEWERSEKSYTPDQIEQTKQSLYRHYGINGDGTGGNSYANKEAIDKMVDGYMKTRIQANKINASFKPKSDSGLDEKITEDNIASEPSVRNIENQVKKGHGTEGEDKDYNNEQVVGYHGQTLKKPVKIDVAAGTQIYDLSGGNKNFINTKLKGVKKMEVAGSELVDVVDAPGTTENGRVVTEQYRKRNPDAKTKKVAMAIVSYEGEPNKIKNPFGEGEIDEKDDKGNPVTKKVTAYVPLKSIRNGVEKKVNGVYKGGLNVDLSLKAEEEYNSGKNKSKEFDIIKTGEGKKTVAVEKANEPIFLHHKGHNYTKSQVEEKAKANNVTIDEYVDWLNSQK